MEPGHGWHRCPPLPRPPIVSNMWSPEDRSSRLRGAMHVSVPDFDEGLRRRLRARFGEEIDPWLDEVPTVLARLGDRWRLRFGALIPQGSMSVVIRCDTADGHRAVLKIAPDRDRIRREAAALATWATPHVPSVYAVDAAVGALLMEAIEPGWML